MRSLKFDCAAAIADRHHARVYAFRHPRGRFDAPVTGLDPHAVAIIDVTERSPHATMADTSILNLRIEARAIGTTTISVADTERGRIAMLKEPGGDILSGREGDIIDGRYRLLRVGPDSADLAYADGRGRQTIRLSGQ